MAKKENKFFSEIKNQIIAGVGLVIAAGFGIFITNMEGHGSLQVRNLLQ